MRKRQYLNGVGPSGERYCHRYQDKSGNEKGVENDDMEDAGRRSISLVCQFKIGWQNGISFVWKEKS